MLSKAIALAAREFEGRKDKGGSPYILHCMYVMEQVSHLGEDVMMAAVLHDVAEDTDITFQDLQDMGFSDTVVNMVDYLTHREDMSYDEYIERMITYAPRSVLKIKMADLRHNSDIHRMKGLRDKDFERLKKYHRTYATLREALK
jgi:(p)ppGpp synthase/HD superfamily hydrolase